MELLLRKFYYIHNKKNSIMHNLSEIKDIMLNYARLTYALSSYLLKLIIIRILIFLKKMVPTKIKSKIKKVLFYNEKFWKFFVFFEKWVKTPPSINKIRLINNIIFSAIAAFFIPLLIVIAKKEKWKILMLERLKNNADLKEKFQQFSNGNKIPPNENITPKINTAVLTKSEIEIYEKLSNALFLIKN
jgi:hypothetical protein